MSKVKEVRNFLHFLLYGRNASTVPKYYRKYITLFCALNVLGVTLPDVLHYNSFFRCLIYLKFRL